MGHLSHLPREKKMPCGRATCVCTSRRMAKPCVSCLNSSSQLHNTNFPGELPSWSLKVFLSFIFFPLLLSPSLVQLQKTPQFTENHVFDHLSLWRASSPFPRGHPSSSDPCVTVPWDCSFNYTIESCAKTLWRQRQGNLWHSQMLFQTGEGFANKYYSRFLLAKKIFVALLGSIYASS